MKPMPPREIWVGLSLQLAALASAWLFLRTLYAIGWLPALLISVPLFLASPFWLLRAPAPLPVRLLLTCWILAIPAWHAAIYALEYRQLKTEIYLIPESFQGKAVVYFGEGVPVEQEGENLLFRLHPDGTLHTQTILRRATKREVNDARAERRQFYSVAPNGTRQKLRMDPNLQGETPLIFPNGESWDGDRITSVDFYIGPPAAIRKLLGSP
jgi:hypothetical protein